MALPAQDEPHLYPVVRPDVRNLPVEEMDFPTSLYEAVMLVPPEAMQMLAPADLKRFYLEGISPASEDLADAAAARRLKLSMFDYLKRKAMTPACGFARPCWARGGRGVSPPARPRDRRRRRDGRQTR